MLYQFLRYLGGTTTFGAGCVIKFASDAYLLMSGPVVCNGGALKSVLTSKDDDLFGERIDGSTGNPTYSAQAAAWIYYQTVPITLSYMQIRWAKTGIRYDGSLAGSLNWIALQQCQTGVLLASTDIELNGVTGCGLATPVAYDTFSKVSGSITIDCAGDADSDGLPDSWEITHFGNTTAQTATLDADGDGLTNLDEYELGLNPVSTDTDYDGRSNADEVLENTNPLDHASYTPVRLGYWRFNTPDWRSEGGYLPRQTLNVFQQPGWSGNGAVVSNSNPAILKYNDVEAGGFANVNCRRGTLRFWLRQNSGFQVQGTWARLVEMGTYTANSSYGFWCLGTNPQGTLIQFVTQDDGVHTTHLQKSIQLDRRIRHQIVLTYDQNRSRNSISTERWQFRDGSVMLPLSRRPCGEGF